MYILQGKLKCKKHHFFFFSRWKLSEDIVTDLVEQRKLKLGTYSWGFYQDISKFTLESSQKDSQKVKLRHGTEHRRTNFKSILRIDSQSSQCIAKGLPFLPQNRGFIL